MLNWWCITQPAGFKRLKSKTEKICILIDVAIPADRNVTQMEEENELKHTRLRIVIQRIWNMKCTNMFIPVITGANRTVTKGLRKNLEDIQENIQYIQYRREQH